MRRKLTPRERLIFALDVDSQDSAKKFITSLNDKVGMFKIGNQLFTSSGKVVLDIIKRQNIDIFLDLKYHDIPNTVASAAIEAVKLGVAMFNVHAIGGYEMMARCVEASEKASRELNMKKPIVLAVTLLTSMSEDSLCQVGIKSRLKDQIILLARLAERAGIDGVVASPEDVMFIRESCGEEFIIVTPGIRPSWTGKDDHKRSSTPGNAIKNGADYIVVGRPIKYADDPVEASAKICREIRDASA